MTLKYYLKDWISIIIASFLYAFGVAAFLQPAEISPGGVTGIATIINYLWGLPTGVVMIVLNLPLIIAGFIKLGKFLIIKTLFATLLSSVFIDIIVAFMPNFTNDKIISALAGGLLVGLGMGILFTLGATSGGTDIGAKLLKIKYPFLSMGRLILILDAVVISISSVVYGNFESAMYAVLAIVVSTTIIDKLSHSGSGGLLAFVITKNPQELKQGIYSAIGRGVSVVNIKGGYSEKDKTLLLCSFRRAQLVDLKRTIKENSSDAFVMITPVNEIYGIGFGEI